MYENVAPTLLCRTINFVVQGRIKEGEWGVKRTFEVLEGGGVGENYPSKKSV